MRLRPSTPLTVVLVVAFAFLLLSVLSTPIVKAIPLGEYRGYSFGVFGYCKPDGSCTSIGIGYDLDNTLSENNDSFNLPSGARQTLSSVLILHPVAAVLVLAMLILAAASHFHSPSHSARFLLALFVFTIITFLVCLASFLVDVLLFIPNLAWGSYIVLASTILVAISGIVICAMRRSLISRKNRRKMIAENAEMNGENFYNREAASKPVNFMGPTAIPLTTGTNVSSGGTADNLPAFATFEDQKKDDQVSDERIPLTQKTSAGAPPSSSNSIPHPNESVGMGGAPGPSAVDRYGNPMNPPVNGYGASRGPSMDSMRSRGAYRGRGYGAGRGGYDMYGAPMRGRGGYGPPPRGGYRGRGLAPPPRGAYGPMRGGRTPPPQPGYGGYYDRRPGPGDGYGSHGRRPSDGYSTNPGNSAPMPNVAGGYDAYSSGASDYPRAESPPMVGANEPGADRAIEMDGTPVEANNGYTPYNGQLRDNDSDVAGMVGLQQGRAPERHNTYMSDGSRYSTDEQYFPARAAWNSEGRASPHAISPLNMQNQQMARGSTSPGVARSDSGNYYEDVDPRFAGPAEAQPPAAEPAYEDIHANNGGSRSPAESERSNFTSISQRGVNPQWNASNAPPMPYHQGPPPRQQAQRRQDMILDNPDFQIPGGAAPHGGPRGNPGTVPGSAYPGL